MRRINTVVVFVAAAWLTACGSLPGVDVPGAGDRGVLAKYDEWLAQVDSLERSLDEAETWISGAPGELAVTVGLPPTASLDEVTAAIRRKIAAGVVSAGGRVTVTVNVEAGASGAAQAGAGGASAQGDAHASVEVIIAVEGGVEASAEIRQVLDAVKLVLRKMAGIKPRFEAVLANIEATIAKGRELLASLPGDLRGVLAVKVAEYTPKFQAAIEMLGGVSGRLTGSIEMSVTIQVDVTASVTAG